MKCTIILLLAACLQVSARGYSQTISVKLKDVSFEKALKEVAKKSGYRFFYLQDQIKHAKPVSIEKENTDVREVLSELFKYQPLKYTITNKTIVVSLKDDKRVLSIINTEDNLGNSPEITPPSIRIKVVDSTGAPLRGASVSIKSSKTSGATDNEGFITLDIKEGDVITVSFIGFQNYQTVVTASMIASANDLVVKLKSSVAELENVDVMVSNGYQFIPKERATGSFSRIDNNLFNRQVSTDIISRLEGLTTGLLFDRRSNPNTQSAQLTIRGASTIMATPSPLIVVDNFPYEGDISTINPNDVESITLLKDAASASIWGARAGNGVIVVTTKRGRLRQPLKVTLNQNISIAEKPNVYYNPEFLNSSEFIDVERFLFSQGYYSADETSPTRPILSPVVELLIKQRDGLITQAEADSKINALKLNDVRRDFDRFLYRPSVNSQLNVNVNGGGANHHAYLSMGYDKNLESLRGNNYSRFTVNSTNSYFPMQGLELTGALIYTQTSEQSNGLMPHLIRSSPSRLLYPYATFVDENGNPAAITKDYRNSFVEQAQSQGLLNWQYKPLDEINHKDFQTRQQDIRLQAGLKYSFTKMFSIEMKYQYQWLGSTVQWLYGEDSYFTRDQINKYTSIGVGGTLIRPIPLGAIVTRERDETKAHAGRLQFNFNRNRQDHRINAIAGFEVRQTTRVGDNYMLYGFDPSSQTSARVDHTTFFTAQPSGFSDVIPNGIGNSSLLDRNVSYFSNAAYTYRNRYTISASARTDGSNLFGINTNQRFVPLWSTGASWKISDEAFYKLSWLPHLKLRATYGYSGNSYNRVSAFVTASYRNDILTGGRSAMIMSPPNPSLRWEKVNTINLGLDFETRNNRISGSIEFFIKKSTDLIGNLPLDPTTGFFIASRYSYVGNGASMRGRGVDIEINTKNTTGKFQWSTTFLFSYANNEVTYYPFKQTPFSYFGTGIPLEGRPLNSMYSYQWGGLDPQNGNPQFILNGVKSANYDSINTNMQIENLVHHGSSLPVVFGAIRNTLQWKGFSLSANILYKLGYYYKRSSIRYRELFSTWSGHRDFSRRWQKPGDELITHVPSMPASTVFSSNRESLYIQSSALVDRGDHIRLQDINLSYSMTGQTIRARWVKEIQVYSLISNIGILWRANKAGIDPDYEGSTAYYPPLRTISVGVKCIF